MVVKKKIFLGSSTEGYGDLKKVAAWLEDKVDLVRWDKPGVFAPGGHVLTDLLELSKTVDGAILFFTPDDLTDFRGEQTKQPRDNVLIEYGIFVATLGPHRAVICQKGVLREAADVRGLTTISLADPRKARKVVETWVDQLPSSELLNIRRVAIHLSETDAMLGDPAQLAAIRRFYMQVLHEFFRLRININTCGARHFRSVAYEFYAKEFLSDDKNREYMERYRDWIRWYWHRGSHVCPTEPPVFGARELADGRTRTLAEARDAAIVVAVCGRGGTVDQIETVLRETDKPVLVVGWFGGELLRFLEGAAGQNPRLIRASGEIRFDRYLSAWPEETSTLAANLTSALQRFFVDANARG